MFTGDIEKNNESVSKRATEIIDNMFFDERSFIAKALIKKHDIEKNVLLVLVWKHSATDVQIWKKT